MSTLGTRMKAAREALDWTQPELAERLGWQRTEVVSVETGKRGNLRSDRLTKLADTLGVSADWLLGRAGAKPPRKPQVRGKPRA